MGITGATAGTVKLFMDLWGRKSKLISPDSSIY